MKRVAASLLAGLWLLAAGGAAAQVLGDIDVGSLRGEPLMARIALPELPEGGVEGLRVRLGKAEDFVRAGIERPSHLTSLEFRTVADDREPAHVLITGREAIDSAFVTFLVEASWPGGRVIREYTVLLDPAPAVPTGFYGPVGETDTLWSLARRYRPEGVSVQRMMIALLAANPHAFTIENVNALREGAVLEIPALEPFGPDDKLSAMQEVRRQNETWRAHLGALGAEAEVAVPAAAPSEVAGDEGLALSSDPEPDERAEDEAAAGETPEAELRVISPGTGEASITGDDPNLRAELDLALEEADSRRQEVQELGARLDEAEQLITDLQRLVELKDDDIAELQRRLVVEAEAAAAARSDAMAQAEVAALAQEEAAVEARAAERARAEAQLQAEIAAAAQAEAQAQAEAAAEARAEAAAPDQAPEPTPDQAEEAGASIDGGDVETDGGEAETAPVGEEEGERGEAEEAATAPPSMLVSLEELLGFSPVVAGVGLVGVILILGGLVALMRRRGSDSEYPDEDEVSDEDASTEALEDELEPGEEAAESADDDASAAPRAQALETELSAGDREPEVDDFDIGIDVDEEAMRDAGEDLVSDLDADRGRAAPERARAPTGESDAGRLPPRPGLDDGAAGDSPAARERAGAAQPGGGAAYASAAGLGAPALSGEGDRDDGGIGFIVGEGPAGDIDETQTKLDLAQTYVDMEDFEDARPLLREVQAEGDLEQRAIARYLAGKLP